MNVLNLEQIIKQHVLLPLHSNANGFHSVLCKVCNDHGRKGLRAGFKFDGNVVGYNCFNCGHTAVYDPAIHTSMPQKMEIVLTAFGIPTSDWNQTLFSSLASGTGGKYVSPNVDIEPDVIPMLSCAVPLTDSDNKWNQAAIHYLETDRAISWKDYPFSIVNTPPEPKDKIWYGRLIIPVYKDKKLIFYQGRDLTDLHPKKYQSPSVPKRKVLFGYNQILKRTPDPLYITEGWFNAFHINGVAIFGNHLTQEHIKWLSKSPRLKVVIPDKYGDGHLLARQAIALGWSVSCPDTGNCKDVNEAIIKYGKLYTFKTIKDNILSGLSATLSLNLYCETKINGK